MSELRSTSDTLSVHQVTLEKLLKIEESISRMLLVMELLVTSLDNSAEFQRAFSKDLAECGEIVRGNGENLSRLRQRFLENGFGTQLAQLLSSLSRLESHLQSIQNTFGGIFAKMIVAIVTAGLTCIIGLIIALLQYFGGGGR